MIHVWRVLCCGALLGREGLCLNISLQLMATTHSLRVLSEPNVFFPGDQGVTLLFWLQVSGVGGANPSENL